MKEERGEEGGAVANYEKLMEITTSQNRKSRFGCKAVKKKKDEKRNIEHINYAYANLWRGGVCVCVLCMLVYQPTWKKIQYMDTCDWVIDYGVGTKKRVKKWFLLF